MEACGISGEPQALFVLVATPAPVVTALIHARTAAGVAEEERKFRKCLDRARDALTSGRVLRGAGGAELACVAKLEAAAAERGVETLTGRCLLSMAAALEGCCLCLLRNLGHPEPEAAVLLRDTLKWWRCGGTGGEAWAGWEARVDTQGDAVVYDGAASKMEAVGRAVCFAQTLLQAQKRGKGGRDG